MPRGNLLSPSYPKEGGMIIRNASQLLPDHTTSHNSKGHSTRVSIIYSTFVLYRLGFHVVLVLRLVIYQQHKSKVVHSQAMKAHGAAEVQLLSFLLSAPSRFDAGTHWREGLPVPRARAGVLQTRKSLLPTDIQSTDHPARSPVIITLTDVRVGILLPGVF